MVKSIKLKNYQAQFLLRVLDSPEHGANARAKSRFIKNILAPKIEEIEKTRLELAEKYAEKKNGKPVLAEDGSNYETSNENFTKLQEEHGEYLKEDFVIDFLPSTKNDILAVKDMIINCSTPWGMQEGMSYNELCEAFEDVK